MNFHEIDVPYWSYLILIAGAWLAGGIHGHHFHRWKTTRSSKNTST